MYRRDFKMSFYVLSRGWSVRWVTCNLQERLKNPLLPESQMVFTDGHRWRFYHQSWGCSWLVVRGDTPGSSLRRRHPPAKGSRPPNHVLFRQNHVLCFTDIRIKSPVRRMRHEMASEKCANRSFWTAFGKAGCIVDGRKGRKGGFGGLDWRSWFLTFRGRGSKLRPPTLSWGKRE